MRVAHAPLRLKQVDENDDGGQPQHVLLVLRGGGDEEVVFHELRSFGNV